MQPVKLFNPACKLKLHFIKFFFNVYKVISIKSSIPWDFSDTDFVLILLVHFLLTFKQRFFFISHNLFFPPTEWLTKTPRLCQTLGSTVAPSAKKVCPPLVLNQRPEQCAQVVKVQGFCPVLTASHCFASLQPLLAFPAAQTIECWLTALLLWLRPSFRADSGIDPQWGGSSIGGGAGGSSPLGGAVSCLAAAGAPAPCLTCVCVTGLRRAVHPLPHSPAPPSRRPCP